MRYAGLLLTGTVFAWSGELDAQRPVEAKDLLRIREVTDPQLSPDAAWVAYELGKPWANFDAWERVFQPFLRADGIVTPTLFVCGQEDWNVPLVNSEQMYQALKSLGRETQLVIYPGESHGINRPSFVLDRMERYLAWYGEYLGVSPAGPSAGR